MSQPVALLQTDIVDSTQLSERLGDAAMARVWADHDRAARDLLHRWHGHEIDRSDGFLVHFETVDHAVGYALEYHRRLAALSQPLRIRAGIHVGELQIRENTASDVSRGAKPFDFAGLAIPITSRVMSLAIGGQTLLTADAMNAIGQSPHRIESHGCWRLKGMDEPFELFEIGEEGAPFTPPPDAAKAYCVVKRNDLWVPRRDVRHSLPAERNAFVGRDEALGELARRLRDGARLISVCGPGGNGKTRLVQRFGWKWLGDFEGGVWFCDLSQATTLDGLYSAVAQGLGVPLGTTPPAEQIGAAIAGRGNCLVIFDNFEQITRFAGETIGRWIDRAHDARFIVTTQAVLRLDGEEVLSLVPMDRDDGAELFVQRARAARRDFTLAGDDEADLEVLIRLLDGLPLAIELAAARVRIMNIRTLVVRMKERFSILTSQGHRPSRQATIRATLDWSWELLSPAERSAIAQAAVFEGGFGLAAFEAVVVLDLIPEAPEVLDVLQALVEKSWLRQTGDQRFALLQSVQEYAAERLAGDGHFAGSGAEARLAALGRHWRHYAGLSEEEAISDGWTDLDNFIAACRRATAAGDAEPAALSLANTWAALKLCGPFQGAIPLAREVDALDTLSGADRALVAWVLGNALQLVHDMVEAQARFEAGLKDARAAGHRLREARLLCMLGEVHTTCSRGNEASSVLEAALGISDELDDLALRCIVLNAMGGLQLSLGRLEQARDRYADALGIARDRHDLRWEGGLLGNLGNALHGLGRLDEARRYYEQALDINVLTGDRRWEGNTRCNLGLLLLELERPDEARALLSSALASARQLGHRRLEFTVLCNLGILSEAEGELPSALQHYVAALANAIASDDRRSQAQCQGYIGLLHARLGAFMAASAALAEGRKLLEEASDQWSLGLLLCTISEAEHLAGRMEDARNACREAEAIAQRMDSHPTSPLHTALRRVRALVDV